MTLLLLMRAIATAAEVATDAQVQRHTWDLVQQVATFLVALGAIYLTLVRPAIRAVMRHWRESVAEIAAAQSRTAEALDRVEHQVHPNGGKSAHDYARKAYELGKQTAAQVNAIRAEQMHHGQRLDLLQGEMTAAGWRQQQLSRAFTERDVAGRQAVAFFREALAEQGITLPVAPTETPTDTEREVDA